MEKGIHVVLQVNLSPVVQYIENMDWNESDSETLNVNSNEPSSEVNNMKTKDRTWTQANQTMLKTQEARNAASL